MDMMVKTDAMVYQLQLQVLQQMVRAIQSSTLVMVKCNCTKRSKRYISNNTKCH